MSSRNWGFKGILQKVLGTDDSAYRGQKKTDHDITEKPAEGAKYENSYKKIYPLGTGVCGCHYPAENVFHYEQFGPYYQMFGQDSGSGWCQGWSCTTMDLRKNGSGWGNMGPEHRSNYNASATNIGTDGNQKEMPQRGGGQCHQNHGDAVSIVTGDSTAVYTGNRGEYGSGNKTMNYEKGMCIGVNKGVERNVWTRWEPDGTFHLQVKPEGGEGGNATVKINPDGSVHITSETTITVESKGTHTIKAPLLKIDAPIKTTSTIESDGDHTAPKFHGCADKAESCPC